MLRRLEEPAIQLALEQRQQRFQRVLTIADEPDVDRIAEPDALRIEIDLYRARLAWFRQVLDIRERGADHQQRVAGL